MKKSFLNHSEPLLVSMVQGRSAARIEELTDLSRADGADAVGMQFCVLDPAERSPETYRRLFAHADMPTYVTNYRSGGNKGKSDETLAEELLELAECGATLCDVMGDYFDVCEGELTMEPEAVRRQMELIDGLHARGAEVLMSSHVLKFTPPERVLEIALEHERRGADICKIVVGAESMEQQIENLHIIGLLKKTLKIPFLFLSGGECRILRRVGGELGCCMYLGVHEYDELATKAQPILSELIAIRGYMKG